MNNTLDILKTIHNQHVHNAAYSEVELATARTEGAQAVVDAIGRGETVMLIDEASVNDLQNAYAVGWNSEWVTARVKG